MVLCEVGGAESVREMCGGVGRCGGRVALWESGAAPLVLAYANEQWGWEVYEAVL